MGQFLNSINDVRKNYSKYDKWEQHQADKRARKEYLAANIGVPQDKLELTQKKAETVIRASEIMDTRSEDNCQNMEQLTSMISVIPIFGLSFLQEPIIRLADKQLTANIRKKAANLENELNKLSQSNPLYQTKKQEYQKLSKKLNKLSKKIRTNGSYAIMGLMFASAIGMILWGNSKQKEASRIGRYQAKQNELNDIKNFVIYTPEQIKKAEEIAASIPDEKEKNSVSKIISELKELNQDKAEYQAWLARKDPDEIEKLKSVILTPEQLQKAREDQELIINIVKDVNIKAEEYSENVENSFDTIGTLSWLIALPLGLGINKLLKFAKANKQVRAAVSTMIPIITPLIIQMQGTIEEKNASRIGRYQARKELLSHPERLIAFSENDMEKASHITAENQKQSFLQKLGGSFSFLASYFKDKSEYNNYKKTVRAENEKLQKAFKEIEITEEQKAEAENLQKHLFTAFDEIDEMSQRYSEDFEAGAEIAKQTASTLWSLGSMAGLAALAVFIGRGKFPIIKAGNKLTNMIFDAKSPIKSSINNVYNTVQKNGKSKVQEFQKALVTGRLEEFLNKTENKEIRNAIDVLLKEADKIGNESITKAMASNNKSDLAKAFSEQLGKHLKQTPAAKWGRNMIAQCGKLWAKSKASKADIEIPKEVQEQLKMNFTYKNYNTLINTGLVAGIPILGVIFAVPYAFNAWITNIQKKAGKIGIMKAMDKIDDPRVFAPEKTLENTNAV